MIGCRHDAKNTLDRNYLYLAEAAGAKVFAQRQVVDLETTELPNGEARHAIVATTPGLRRDRSPLRLTASHVVFSAGVLGTVKLLAALKENHRLPHMSDRLGDIVRTNSESIPGAVAPSRSGTDYSQGIAISSSIYPNDHTHIEGVRYPKGSNAMALLGTIMVPGAGRVPRQMRFAGQVFRHPVRFLRSLSVRRWSERSVILLVMQSRDNSINLRWRRRGDGVKLKSAKGDAEPNPSFIPEAETAAVHAADYMGGEAFGTVNEALLNVPVTAHILGGCVIGATAADGVIDGYQRVFGCPGLHVADGSAISGNLGVNPSLTIAAQTERAMAMWPNKGEGDSRPRLGEGYRPVSPVSPRNPAVPEGAPAALGW